MELIDQAWCRTGRKAKDLLCMEEERDDERGEERVAATA
jgi:hypothetical protein